MVPVFLGLGSNCARERNLLAALAALRTRFGEVVCSPVYESEPHGHSGAAYFNLVVRLETTLTVAELKQCLRQIEVHCGRVRDGVPDVCALDIDLLLYGDLVGVYDGVQLPHRDVLARAYVLQPLAMLAPTFVHPVLQRTLVDLWREFPGHAPLREVSLPSASLL